MKKISISSALFVILTMVTVFAGEQGNEVTREGLTFVVPYRWNIPDGQPKGKRKFKETVIFMTKDGYHLERIEFRKRLITADFSHTKKRLSKGMMPQEMAEVVLNDHELNEAMKNLKVIENKPATINGLPGFRLVLSFRENGQLQYQSVCYGFQQGDMFYTILFMAPKRHYFETNLGSFEQVVKSLKVEAETVGTWSPGEES